LDAGIGLLFGRIENPPSHTVRVKLDWRLRRLDRQALRGALTATGSPPRSERPPKFAA